MFLHFFVVKKIQHEWHKKHTGVIIYAECSGVLLHVLNVETVDPSKMQMSISV